MTMPTDTFENLSYQSNDLRSAAPQSAVGSSGLLDRFG